MCGTVDHGEWTSVVSLSAALPLSALRSRCVLSGDYRPLVAESYCL